MTTLPEPYFRDPSDSDGPERLIVVALAWSSSVYNPLGHQNTGSCCGRAWFPHSREQDEAGIHEMLACSLREGP